MISIKTYTPKSLTHLVKSFWYMEVGHEQAVYEEEIIPDGHIEILFYLKNNSARREHGNSRWIIQPDAFIAGQTLKSHQIKMFAGAALYGIRFYPHTLFPFLKLPLNYITDGILPLNDVTNAAGFWNCMAPSPDQTFENFERYLAEKLAVQILNNAGYQYVNRAMNHILANNGILSINNIRETDKITPKYYGDLFKKYVGITPKHLCNILKINQFISNKINQPALNFTECTYESGYYDQSHLIKSFHQLIETSPRGYFENTRAISNMFAAL
jgi:AraC-like DNA-binding protein